MALVASKLLAPANSAPPAAEAAPIIAAAPEAGSESDLEARIDEPPLDDRQDALQAQALERLFGAHPLTAMVQVEATRQEANGVFVDNDCAVALVSATAWDAAAARDAVSSAIQGMLTASRLGMSWKEAAGSYAVLEGLNRLALAVRGNTLVLANSPRLVERVLARAAAPAAARAGVYAAGLRHERERRNFRAWMRLLDSARPASDNTTEPKFFSGNLASLSDSLRRVRSATLTAEEKGPAMKQTVVYELAP
jgi:hypothetical protein